MRKRIYKIIIIFLMSIFIINLNIAYAVDRMHIDLEDAKGKQGEEITINLKLENNQGVRILGGKISFDRSKLDYISCELKNLENAVNRDIQYNESTGNIVFYATTMTNDDEPIMDNDVIASIKLKIKPEATGTTEVKISMNDVSAGIGQEITDYIQKNAVVTIIEEGTSDENPNEETNQQDNKDVQDENNEPVNISNNENNQGNNNKENQEENENQEQKTAKMPSTGDIAVGVFIALLIISVIGITIILVKRKKKK